MSETTACNKKWAAISIDEIFQLVDEPMVNKALFSGVRVFCNEFLPDDYWEIHCGKKLYEELKDVCIEVEKRGEDINENDKY